MNNANNIYKAVELADMWVVEANGNSWTGELYKTEKDAQSVANYWNKILRLV